MCDKIQFCVFTLNYLIHITGKLKLVYSKGIYVYKRGSPQYLSWTFLISHQTNTIGTCKS